MDGIMMIDEHDKMSVKLKKRIGKMALNGTFGRTDMPMVGTLARESKKRNSEGYHRYVLVLRFKQSRRHYDDEIIHAVDKKNALRIARCNHPNARIK